LLATGDLVRMFELPSGRLLGEYKIAGSIGAITGGTDRFAVAGAKDVLVLSTDGTQQRLAVPAPPTALIALPAGKLLVFDTTSARLYGSALEQTIAIDHTDQDMFGIGAGNLVAVTGLKEVLIFDPTTDKLATMSGHQAPTLDGAFDHTGARLVTTSQDGTAIVWDVATRTLLHRLVSRSQYLSHAVFDPTGRMIIALDGGGHLQIFDIESGALVGEIDGVLASPQTLHRANDGSYSAFDAAGTLATWHLQADIDPLADAISDLACKAPPNETVGVCARTGR
jgi:hypothetical protein